MLNPPDLAYYQAGPLSEIRWQAAGLCPARLKDEAFSELDSGRRTLHGLSTLPPTRNQNRHKSGWFDVDQLLTRGAVTNVTANRIDRNSMAIFSRLLIGFLLHPRI